jgi:hypothetical protein
MRIASWGHALFAATMIILGILGLIKGAFTPVWLPVPKGVPAREVLVYLSAIVSLVCGIALLWQRAAAAGSLVLLSFLLAWLLLLDAPDLFLDPGMQLVWAACKTAVMVAAAWVCTSGSPATVTVSASVSPPATQGSASRGRYTAWP